MGDATFGASLDGLVQALAPSSIASLVIGVVVGGLVGALPGLGGPAAVALLLPFVFDSPPAQAFALLIGLISVTSTTGDLTSILLGVPGESTAAATVLDGHPLARQGQAGRAMGASLGASLAGALFGAVAMGLGVSVARPLSRAIASPELFALAVVGVCCALPLASQSPLRGLASGTIGLALATVGLDPLSGTPRFTMGQLPLWDGIGLIPAALGLFAVPEIVALAGRGAVSGGVPDPGRRQFLWGLREVANGWRVVLRSSAIGTGVGLLPGVGASVSQWMAYADAARRSRESVAFGDGAIDGVMAPSAANNATLGGALVPTLALGVPGGLASALFLTALVVKGYVPGPQMLLPERDGGHLAFVFSLGWMMALANILIVALTWTVSPWLVRITRVRASVLAPVLVLIVCVGASSERRLMADVLLMVVLSAVGLTLTRFDWPRAPLLVGLVLGPLAENRLFISLEAYGATWWARPGVILLGVAATGLMVHPVLGRWRRPAEGRAPAAAGERLLLLACAAIALGALGSTMSFPARAALFPRVSLIALLAALAVIGVRAAGAARAHGSGVPAPRETSVAGAAPWVFGSALAIWALGFTWGGVPAIGAMMAMRGERLRTVLAAMALAVLFVEVVMARALQMPLPGGIVFEGLRGLTAD